MVILESGAIEILIQHLKQKSYQIYGPSVHDEAIVYDKIDSHNDLPVGVTDEQAAGRYRLKDRSDKAYFGYVVGPFTWKRFLHMPRLTLWKARKKNDRFEVIPPENGRPPKLAFLGVRPCELAAIGILDKVFLEGTYTDTHYQQRRENLLIIAVNCTEPGENCFCEAMNTGPAAGTDCDLALTEIVNEKEHYFIAKAHSNAGEKLLAALPHQPAADATMKLEKTLLDNARKQMTRVVPTGDVKALLWDRIEDQHWEHIAERCLSCGNCTMVCPTCFCTTVEDVTDLSGKEASRVRLWDSCFNIDYSYIHGGSVRDSVSSRYRQWLTHKLATWQEQFGTMGCVGCGRCITWCPVGIDWTEEIKVFQEHHNGRS